MQRRSLTLAAVCGTLFAIALGFAPAAVQYALMGLVSLTAVGAFDAVGSILAFVAVIGLIASFHTIIYAKGRQIYSLSRAGYFPTGLSVSSLKKKVKEFIISLLL